MATKAVSPIPLASMNSDDEDFYSLSEPGRTTNRIHQFDDVQVHDFIPISTDLSRNSRQSQRQRRLSYTRTGITSSPSHPPINERRLFIDENESDETASRDAVPLPSSIQNNNRNIRMRRDFSTKRRDVRSSPPINSKKICSVCYLDQEKRLFATRICHQCSRPDRTVCDQCIENLIVTTLIDSFRNRIGCPEDNCYASIPSDYILVVLRKLNIDNLFDRYEFHLTKTFLENEREFCWCANGCGSGQFYPRLSHPKMICSNCEKFTCFIHQVPWHHDNDCNEYQQQIEKVDSNTRVYLDKKTKPCPNCLSNIEKYSGCDHMTCTRCRAQFCWECLAVYGPHDTPFTAEHQPNCTNSYMRERLLGDRRAPDIFNRPSLPRRIYRSIIPRSSTCAIL